MHFSHDVIDSYRVGDLAAQGNSPSQNHEFHAFPLT
jgi:hypothetical protein